MLHQIWNQLPYHSFICLCIWMISNNNYCCLKEKDWMSILFASLISVFLGAVLSDNHLEPPYGGPYYMPQILCRGLLPTGLCVRKNYIYTDGCNLILCTDLFQGTYSYGSGCQIELAYSLHYQICQEVRRLGWKRRQWALKRTNIWIRRMSKIYLFILFLILWWAIRHFLKVASFANFIL